jgi:hypothetical protein
MPLTFTKGDATRRFVAHQELFGKNDMFDLKESVTRQVQGFDASAERARKTGFMAMVNTNCKRPPTSRIRGLFGYAVFQELNKPVHMLGFCPLEPRGSELAGVTKKVGRCVCVCVRSDGTMRVAARHSMYVLQFRRYPHVWVTVVQSVVVNVGTVPCKKKVKCRHGLLIEVIRKDKIRTDF